jgi:predicted  nucleic acid-binding Zn-ribbon protein
MAPNPSPYPPQPAKSSSNLPLALAGGAIVAMLAGNIYLFIQIQDLKKDSIRTRDEIQSEIDKVVESTTAVGASSRKHAEQLREELDRARRQALDAANSAAQRAKLDSAETAKRLENEQAQMQQKLSTDIGDVKQQAVTANTKIDSVSTDVTSVKGDVASTKGELEKTIAELKSVRGDLSGTNSLVATNGKELAALRRLGERNYTEFKLIKTKEPQRVGDIALLLKKTDPKKNKFTIEVRADDKSTEKRDRNINEPVQFYVAKAAQPYELVVNDVKKDQISGYLSTPKDRVPRN